MRSLATIALWFIQLYGFAQCPLIEARLNEYVEQYAPSRSVNQAPAKLPNDAALKELIEEALACDSAACRTFLSLLLLKTYESHLACCNQAFVIGPMQISQGSSPVVYWFQHLTKANSNTAPQPALSSIAYDYLKEHPALAKDKRIRHQLRLIDNHKRRIAKGI
jgi:hypothetical protein